MELFMLMAQLRSNLQVVCICRWCASAGGVHLLVVCICIMPDDDASFVVTSWYSSFDVEFLFK